MKILITGGSGFIGTNYIEMLMKNGCTDFINLDINPPRNAVHKPFWRECSLLDADRLKRIIKEFAPTHVVHLGAVCGMDGKDLGFYAANIQGIENLLAALDEAKSVERVIFTSTLLVCRIGYYPKNDTDFQPSTLYGKSKMLGEKIIRSRKALPYSWLIIRPISIWGPWVEKPYKHLFKSIAQGWFFHVGHGRYMRSLGYVENSVHQIHQLLLAPSEKVQAKTFYIADETPLDLFSFAGEIQKSLGARKIWHLPVGLMQLAAKIGDFLKSIGWHNVPMTSFRLNNIRTDCVFDISPLMEISGPLPYSYKEGVERTVQWLRSAGEI